MFKLKIFLTTVGEGLGFVVTGIAILAFLRSVWKTALARALSEVVRLKLVVRKQTVAGFVQIDIIQSQADEIVGLNKRILELEEEVIVQHREHLETIHRTEDPKSLNR